MKKIKIASVIVIIFSVLFLSCTHYCVQCDIYDSEGYFVKDYGEYCGEWFMVNDYEEDAQWHAEYYYGGFADCY